MSKCSRQKLEAEKHLPPNKKIRELKKRVSKVSLKKSKSKNPYNLIKMSVDNMNKTISPKYGISPGDVEKRSLSSENLQLGFNFDQIKTVKKVHNVLNKYDTKIYL